MISRKLHYEGCGIAREHSGFLQHDARDDDRRDADEVGRGRYPPCAAEQSRGDQRDYRKLRAAGNEGGGHYCHAAVALIFDGTRSHYARYAAAGADQHRYEGFARKTEFAEYAVHDEGYARHITAGLEEREQDEQDQHLGNEAEHSSHAADYTVEQQTVEPFGSSGGFKSALHQRRNAGNPDSVFGGVRYALGVLAQSRVVKLGNIISALSQRIGEGAVGLVKGREILVGYGVLKIGRADDVGCRSGVYYRTHFIGPDIGEGVFVHRVLIFSASDAEQMPAVAEDSVICPVGDEGTDGRNRYVIYEEHYHCEYGERSEPVSHNTVDLIGYRQYRRFFLVAGLHQRGDVNIALVGDNRLGVVVQLGLGGFYVGFDVFENHLIQLQLFENLVVPLEDLDCVPALLSFGQIMHRRLLDVRQRVLNRTGKGMLRNRFDVSGGVDGGFGGFHYAVALERRDFDDLTAELTRQLPGVDAVAVLFDDVHHIDGDHDRYAKLGQLGGQIKIALEVRSVDDVEYRVGTIADQIVTRHYLLEGVGRQGIDSGQVGDYYTVMLFEPSLLLLDGYAGPVSDELIRAGQGVEQRGFSAVRIARQSYSQIHCLFLSFLTVH